MTVDPADVAAPQDRAGLGRADDLPAAARRPQGGKQQLDRPAPEVRQLLGALDGRQRRDRAAVVAAARSRAGARLHDPQAGPSWQPQRDRRTMAAVCPARAGRGQPGPEQRLRAPPFRNAQPAAAQQVPLLCEPTSSARSRSRATAASWQVVRALARQQRTPDSGRHRSGRRRHGGRGREKNLTQPCPSLVVAGIHRIHGHERAWNRVGHPAHAIHVEWAEGRRTSLRVGSIRVGAHPGSRRGQTAAPC